MLANIVAEAVKVHGGDVQQALASVGGDKLVLETFGGSHGVDGKGTVSLAPQDSADGRSVDAPREVTKEFPGRYRIEEGVSSEIGRGGMGRVLVAFDEHLGREIAFKELLADASDSPSVSPRDGGSKTSAASTRFLREARVTGLFGDDQTGRCSGECRDAVV